MMLFSSSRASMQWLGRRSSVLWMSTKASAADVGAIKKLRELSGAPMMDCKNALASPDVQGDLQKALAWLRAKGIAKIASSSRATKEGLIGVHSSVERGTVTLVEVNCETGMNIITH